MTRTEIAINGTSAFLAQEQDIDALKRRIEAVVQTGAGFVDFVVVGNRNVSVLVSSQTQVVISDATVVFDPRDTGDEDMPFGGFYDL